MGTQRGKVTPLNTHNETNSESRRAENPCATSIFTKRIRSIVSIPMVSKLSTLFGPSGATRTPGLLNPNQARYQLRYTRIFNFCHDTTAGEKIKDFSVCGHSCGQSRFCAVFGSRRETRYCPCRKALRRFALPCSGYRHGTPKCGTVPTPPYPDRGGGTPPDHGRRTLTISDFLRSCKGEISRSERPSEPPHGR